MARRSSPSWVWLLLAAGLVVFALVWLLNGADDAEPPRALDETGRRPFPSGGDFSSVRREVPIEAREAPASSIMSGRAPAASGGAGGAAPAARSQ